jgi:hypothetical protein
MGSNLFGYHRGRNKTFLRKAVAVFMRNNYTKVKKYAGFALFWPNDSNNDEFCISIFQSQTFIT